MTEQNMIVTVITTTVGKTEVQTFMREKQSPRETGMPTCKDCCFEKTQFEACCVGELFFPCSDNDYNYIWKKVEDES